jgi:hypothetical protein
MSIFEAGRYVSGKPERQLSALCRMRTYTLSQEIEFESAASQLTPVDTGKTAAGVFGGVAFSSQVVG